MSSDLVYSQSLQHNATSSDGESSGYYNYLFRELADPRTNDWWLMSDPWAGICILIVYLIFVLRVGPWLMKNREPFKLTKVLLVYNFVQVLISIWLFYEALEAGWLRKYSWTCQPVDYSNNPDAMRMARGVYSYFLAKLTELLDTVFFVLRKKDNQVTFLHLYHHTSMPMVSWGAAKYFPGGHGTFIGLINSFVHIIMYTYYLLAALGPGLQKYLWWKKYITTLQLAQFCLVCLHSAQLLVYDCPYPRFSLYFTMPNAVFFYFLFYDFYKKAYTKGDKTKGLSAAKQQKDKLPKAQRNGELQNGKTTEAKEDKKIN